MTPSKPRSNSNTSTHPTLSTAEHRDRSAPTGRAENHHPQRRWRLLRQLWGCGRGLVRDMAADLTRFLAAGCDGTVRVVLIHTDVSAARVRGRQLTAVTGAEVRSGQVKPDLV